MANDDYEGSDPDEWEDYDPDADYESDDLDGFEVYDSEDDYLEKLYPQHLRVEDEED